MCRKLESASEGECCYNGPERFKCCYNEPDTDKTHLLESSRRKEQGEPGSRDARKERQVWQIKKSWANSLTFI